MDRRMRISRTFVPSATIQQSSPRTHNLTYFYKIKGNFKMLEKYDFDHNIKKRNDQSLTCGRFRLSKRLEHLSHAKPKKQRCSDNQINQYYEKRARANSQRDVAVSQRDDIYDLEIANINKTINGTRLGALSALQIMDEMEVGEEEQKHSSFYGFDKLVKRMDSDFAEDIYNHSKIKKMRETCRLSSFEGPKTQQKKLEVIYDGAEGFLEKYREYQISLLQKIPSYKSRQLTLDYKNQWRI